MLLPPPNVTGALHIGHALTVTVQDALARWRRMRGQHVVWVPGLDHAGIATQTVVEKALAASTGQTRHDLGREQFIGSVHDWVAAYSGRIRAQLARLGASVAWQEEVFTLDATRSTAVTQAFVELARRGLVQRGNRIVNWCPSLHTALSDVEVDVLQIEPHTDVRIPVPAGGAKAAGQARHRTVQLGQMDEFGYPVHWAPELQGPPGMDRVRVCTTRLETMLGDVGIAVHPDDARYAPLVAAVQAGQARIVHPFTGRVLRLVTDATLVDPEVGTGAVKLTPAHDPADFAAAERNGLSIAESVCMDAQGRLCGAAEGTPFAGMDRFDARGAVREALQAAGLWYGQRGHAMAVALCSRSGDVLEPMLLPQWYVDCSDMAARALQAVQQGTVSMLPEKPHADTWHRWLGAIQPWCVSRQLWWGHRIPAWRVQPGAPAAMAAAAEARHPLGVVAQAADGTWVIAKDEEDARAVAASVDPAWAAAAQFAQDEDVLDTWFSSGLLPLSMNEEWVHDGKLSAPGRYPLGIMETGSDILFFWVARMMMLCTELSGQVPFHAIALHPMVRDKSGRKMSKSLGNVIDPVAVIEGRTLNAMLASLRGSASSTPTQANSGVVSVSNASILGADELARAEAGMKAEFPSGIPACGTDALRLALACYMTGQGTGGGSINLDIEKVHEFRLFANKMWNATRFILQHLPEPSESTPVHAVTHDARTGMPCVRGMTIQPYAAGRPLLESWALHRALCAAHAVDEHLHNFELGLAASTAQRFFQQDLCDVLIEWSKPALHGAEHTASVSAQQAAAVLATVADLSLRLLHPFMPFVSEELWQRLHFTGVHGTAGGVPGAEVLDQPSIAAARWPASQVDAATLQCHDWYQPEAAAAMDHLLAIATAIRSVMLTARTAVGSDAAARCVLHITCAQQHGQLQAHTADLAAVTRCGVPIAWGPASSGALLLRAAVPGFDGSTVQCELPSGMDVHSSVAKAAQTQQARVMKLEKRIHKLAARVHGPAANKMPAHVLARDQAGLAADQDALAQAQTTLHTLQQLKEQCAIA